MVFLWGVLGEEDSGESNPKGVPEEGVEKGRDLFCDLISRATS